MSVVGLVLWTDSIVTAGTGIVLRTGGMMNVEA